MKLPASLLAVRSSIALLLTASMLAGCGSPATRADNPDLFLRLQSGKVDPRKVGELTDCLMDGFSRAQTHGSNVQVKQQRRSDGFRAEVYAGPSLLISADIQDDGATQLLEGYAAKFIPTKKEQAEYRACIEKLGVVTS